MEVNPETVINDLLDQIKKLTLENSMLRAALTVTNSAQVNEDATSAE